MELEVKVPENLSEISLDQYQKYLKVQAGDNDEMFIAQKMIEIFCNVELKYVTKMRWKDVSEITSTLSNMFDEDNKFINKFTLDNVQYGFIPNLDEITFGEFVDLDSYLGDWQEMHKAMSVLYRPIDIQARGRYNIKEYDGSINDHIKQMPLSVALGAVFFFVEFRKRIISSYDGLFGQGDSQGSFTSEGGFNAKWNWYSSIYTASQGNLEKFEYITKQHAHKVLMYLEYVTEKQILENQKIKRSYGKK
jgi:hypothetical protein